MKTLIIFSLLILQSLGFQSLAEAAVKTEVKPLAKFTQLPGFQPNPEVVSVTVWSDRRVTTHRREVRSGESRSYFLLKLSAVGFKELEKKMQQISDSQLKDLDPEGAECVDAPTKEIAIYKGKQKRITYRWYNCHTFKIEDNSADQVNDFILGLGSLVM